MNDGVARSSPRAQLVTLFGTAAIATGSLTGKTSDRPGDVVEDVACDVNCDCLAGTGCVESIDVLPPFVVLGSNMAVRSVVRN